MKSVIFLSALFTAISLSGNCLFQQQSTILVSHKGFEYSPNNQATLLLFTIQSRLLSLCAHKCLLIINCQIFNYDFLLQRCRLYEADDDYLLSIINSSSVEAVVGSIQPKIEEFSNYGHPCSYCMYSRYLECVNSICQCRSHSYYDGSICRSKQLIGGECNDTKQCRNDLNLTCLSSFRCGNSLYNVSFNTTTITSSYMSYFQKTGSLSTVRRKHTASLLNTNQVLVVGRDPATITTELYEPINKTWSISNSTIYERCYHTASLLFDDTLLIVGGSGSNALNTAELYNTQSKAWTLVDNLNYGRIYHTATVMENGHVLVTGGGNSSKTVEIYDPSTKKWTIARNMSFPRKFHTATALNDGYILVVGGDISSSDKTAELYDRVNDIWIRLNDTIFKRTKHTAVLLSDGKVLVIGGSDPESSQTSELYNPITRIWTRTNDMNIKRFCHVSTILSDGRVLSAGGYYFENMAEIYDPTTQQWTLLNNMTVNRAEFAASMLPDGNVLLVAGDTTYPSTAEIFYP